MEMRWLVVALAPLCTVAGIEDDGQPWVAHHEEHWGTLVTVTAPKSKSKMETSLRTVTESLLKSAFSEKGKAMTNVGGWQSEHDFLRPRFSEPSDSIRQIRAFIEGAIQVYYKSHGFKGKAIVRMFASWANVNKPENWNKHHRHNGDLAGAFYLKCPEGQCAIELEDPRSIARSISVAPDSFFSTLNNRSEMITVRPREGQVILFPGWMKHYVAPYTGQGKESDIRISVSFNVDIDKLDLQAGQMDMKFLDPKTQEEYNVPEDILATKLAVKKIQVGLTPMTLLRPKYNDANREKAFSAMRKSLRSGAGGKSLNLLYESDKVVPGITSAREMVEASLKHHLLGIAKSMPSLGGEATVWITGSWSNTYTPLKPIDPHKQLGSDLSGALCVSCPEYMLAFDDPRQFDIAVMFMHNERTDRDTSKKYGQLTRQTSATQHEEMADFGVRVWPSWLAHTPSNIRQGSNVIISFAARVQVSPGSPPLRIRFKEDPGPSHTSDEL